MQISLGGFSFLLDKERENIIRLQLLLHKIPGLL